MNNYLLELENEIISRWSGTYDKLRKSPTDDSTTSLGVCIKTSPCWYIFAEYDGTIISIDLFIIDDKADFNQVIWSLTSAAHPDMKSVKRIQKYWVKPVEVQSGYETVYFTPGDSPDKKSISIMTVKDVVTHISSVF
jgi:hypothetical protein